MNSQHLILLVAAMAAFLAAGVVESKTVFRRKDKISENFKELNLAAEEIDPNVAPPEPQKVQTLDPEDVSAATSAVAAAAATVEDEIEGTTSEVANEIIDESVNEIADSAAPATSATSAAAAASASPVGGSPVGGSPAAAKPVATPAATSTPPAAGAAGASAATAAPAATTAATTAKPVKNDDDKNPVNKYCKCTASHCDCCRNFSLPLIPVRGPGCAKIAYVGNDEMSVSIKYGDITLASRRISSRRARPICVGLPGGYSKFCGRVYGLSRAKENFKACLAFELRAEDEVEAALRVSCFKFGPEGLRVAEAEPLPADVNKDEDEDDDDIFGFAAGGDDDEDEEDDYDDGDEPEPETDADADDDDGDYGDDDEAEAPEDADYGGFSLGGLLDELDDDDDDKKPAKPAVTTPALSTVTDQTRDVVPTETQEDTNQSLAQSKDEAGTPIAESEGNVETTAVITPPPAITSAGGESTTVNVKSKKSKKAKKNKKKKAAAAETESDFAYELLNGILDFFN